MMQRSAIRKAASFLRWRLVPVRYVGRLGTFSPQKIFWPTAPQHTEAAREVEARGHAQGPSMSPDELSATLDFYGDRLRNVPAPSSGHPFVDLTQEGDFTADNPLMKFLFSEQLVDVALDYFGGRCVLDGVNLLYSFPQESDALAESQYWHLDYDDSRSFHCVVYLNDVLADKDGPFVYVDRKDTKRIHTSPFVRRIDDQTFASELGDGEIRKFLGKAGSSVFVDPAVCYHYGSRCKSPRIAAFLTFNSDWPYVRPDNAIRQNKDNIRETVSRIRPDLAGEAIDQLLSLA